ncbi:MAG: hypothetical protein JW857_02995 [Bacteroidales bacterium]|nr:hypothetical protein [Bacteroidales bacterium]
MKQISIVLIGIFISIGVFAQGPGNRMEIEKRYRAQKIAFITDKMQLTPDESKVFWPIYTQFEADKDNLANEMRSYRAKFPSDENELSEEQAMELLGFFNKHTAAMFKLNQDYQKKLLKVISAKKILLLNDAENGFRRHLLQEFRGRNANRRQN